MSSEDIKRLADQVAALKEGIEEIRRAMWKDGISPSMRRVKLAPVIEFDWDDLPGSKGGIATYVLSDTEFKLPWRSFEDAKRFSDLVQDAIDRSFSLGRKSATQCYWTSDDPK